MNSTEQEARKKLYPDAEKNLRVKTKDSKTSEALEFIDEYGRRFEEVYLEKEKKAMFATINEAGELIVTPNYILAKDGNSSEVIPILDDAIEKKAILFAEKAEELGSVVELIEEIRSHIHRYLDVSPDFEVFSAYYILMSWVYEKMGNVPYLRAMGDTGCGKSRFLDVTGRLCYRAIMASGAVTPAPIYRLIERYKGTLVLDEADFDKDSTEKNEVVKILNCGYEKNRPIIRCDPANVSLVEFHDAFGPKILATRFSFQDKALESRCLTQVMSQTSRTDIPVQLTPKFYDEEMHLRNKLLCFRLKYLNTIEPEKVVDLDMQGIEPRLKQVTSSFAVLFSNIPEVWARFQNFMKDYNGKLIEERADSMTGYVVVALLNLLKDGKDNVSSKDISGKILEQQGFEPGSKAVGKQLKALGFETENIRVDGKRARFVNITGKKTLLSSLITRYISENERSDYSTLLIEKQTKLERVERLEHDIGGSVTTNVPTEVKEERGLGTCGSPPHTLVPLVPHVPEEQPIKLTPTFIASELRDLQETYRDKFPDGISEQDLREHLVLFDSSSTVDMMLETAIREGLIFRTKGGLRAV